MWGLRANQAWASFLGAPETVQEHLWDACTSRPSPIISRACMLAHHDNHRKPQAMAAMPMTNPVTSSELQELLTDAVQLREGHLANKRQRALNFSCCSRISPSQPRLPPSQTCCNSTCLASVSTAWQYNHSRLQLSSNPFLEGVP